MATPFPEIYFLPLIGLTVSVVGVGVPLSLSELFEGPKTQFESSFFRFPVEVEIVEDGFVPL